MKIESISELKKLIQMLRANGVHSIEIDGIKMQIDALPSSDTPAASEPKNGMLPTSYTDEQILFFSSEDQIPSEAS